MSEGLSKELDKMVDATSVLERTKLLWPVPGRAVEEGLLGSMLVAQALPVAALKFVVIAVLNGRRCTRSNEVATPNLVLVAGPTPNS